MNILFFWSFDWLSSERNKKGGGGKSLAVPSNQRGEISVLQGKVSRHNIFATRRRRMSSLDCCPNVVETDGFPNFSVSASSLDCLQPASWEMDSNANFSWNLSDSWKKRKDENSEYWSIPVKNISPPTLSTLLEMAVPRVRKFFGTFCHFWRVTVFERIQMEGLGPRWIHLHSNRW